MTLEQGSRTWAALNKGGPEERQSGRERLRVGRGAWPARPAQASQPPGRQAGPRASGIRDGGRVTPWVAHLILFNLDVFSLFPCPIILTTFPADLWSNSQLFSSADIYSFNRGLKYHSNFHLLGWIRSSSPSSYSPCSHQDAVCSCPACSPLTRVSPLSPPCSPSHTQGYPCRLTRSSRELLGLLWDRLHVTFSSIPAPLGSQGVVMGLKPQEEGGESRGKPGF